MDSDSHPRRRRKLAAILMADIASFSAMMERDEERTTALVTAFQNRVLTLVEAHNGRVVGTGGDSVFGEFGSVVDAVECARDMQEDQAARNEAAAPEERLEVRIGLHLGDVLVEEYEVFGEGVNIAARLEQQAPPGGLMVSEAVYDQVRNKIDIAFNDEGLSTLRNIEHPVRTFSVSASAFDAKLHLEADDPEARSDSAEEPHYAAAPTASRAGHDVETAAFHKEARCTVRHDKFHDYRCRWGLGGRRSDGRG